MNILALRGSTSEEKGIRRRMPRLIRTLLVLCHRKRKLKVPIMIHNGPVLMIMSVLSVPNISVNERHVAR